MPIPVLATKAKAGEPPIGLSQASYNRDTQVAESPEEVPDQDLETKVAESAKEDLEAAPPTDAGPLVPQPPPTGPPMYLKMQFFGKRSRESSESITESMELKMKNFGKRMCESSESSDSMELKLKSRRILQAIGDVVILLKYERDWDEIIADWMEAEELEAMAMGLKGN